MARGSFAEMAQRREGAVLPSQAHDSSRTTLRVLHVIAGLPLGGAETALYRLITGSRGSECTHAVVVLTRGGALCERFRNAGIELIHLDFKTSPVSGFFSLLSVMKEARPDIVQTWMYHADMFGGLAARLSGIRSVVWGIRTAELTSGDARATVAVRKGCAWLSRWVPDTIVCVAETARRTHVGIGYDAARMVVVPNGFDLSGLAATAEQRRAFRNECGFADDEPVIGMVGRFNASKGQHNFVQAGGLLARRFDKVRFLMVGPDVTAANAQLMGWIDRTGHADRFRLLGARADVAICLAGMDIFCLPSRTEAFPNSLGEAMAMGLPCVATDVGDAALLLADTGTVVPKEDPVALAGGLAAMINISPEARISLGQRARKRIQDEFTLEITRNRFEALYRQLLRRPMESKR